MSGKNKIRQWEDFLNYLKGTLSGKERHELEKDLESEPFSRDAMEGFELIGAGAAEKDMADLKIRLHRRLRQRRRIVLYSAAAAIASLLIVSTVFVKLYDFSPDQSKQETADHFTPADSSREPDHLKNEEIIAVEPTPAKEPKAEKVARTNDREAESEPDRKATRSYQQVEKAEKSDETELVVVPDMAFESNDKTISKDIRYVDEEANKSDEQPIKVVEAEPTPSSIKESETKMGKSAEALSVQGSAPAISSDNQKSISGMVISSEDSTPIPGATVLLKGTAMGTVTDPDGNFNMTYSGDTTPTLVASFVGMKSKEMKLADQSRVTVAMDPDNATLNEVVVVGYSKSARTLEENGAVSEINMTDVQGVPEYTPPKPEDGYPSVKEFITENLSYPEDTDRSDRVVVVLRFTVRSSGLIENMEVLRTGGPAFSKEAERLIMAGPDWKPAERNGEKVDDQVKIRIVFERNSGEN